FFELKAKHGGLYLSSNTYQMKGHIDNASRRFASERRKFTDFKPIVNLITTADVRFSFGIAAYAMSSGVTYAHYWAQYRIVNGTWQFKFTTHAK
ncbi:MAG TPA: hypothetical protein DCO90_10455, partial [Sphingobacterium sp.]|nr:hypothetical protein [Sphingobacterium sp.]